jgi:DNA-binding transcriptional MerR regulator
MSGSGTIGSDVLTVTKAARAVGVAASTLRYYEREGLVAPSGKSRAGYRLYDADAVARLRFVRAAQAIGLPLKDVRTVLELDARTGRARMRGLLESRLAQVERRLAHLTTVHDALTRALARCRRSGDCCSVLVSLNDRTRPAKGEQRHEDLPMHDHRDDRPVGRGPGRMPARRRDCGVAGHAGR